MPDVCNDLMFIKRSQILEYSRETLFKHAFDHLEAARPGSKMATKSHTYIPKRLTIIDLFERL